VKLEVGSNEKVLNSVKQNEDWFTVYSLKSDEL